MKAGFAEADITPKAPCAIGGYGDYFADEVLSPLFARALYVEGSDGAWTICSSDLIGLDRAEICMPVISALRAKGFEGGILLTASHTHSGPHTRFPTILPVTRRCDEYVERVRKALVDIIMLARSTAVPAEIGVGRTFAGENINRRVTMEDGTHFYLPEHKELYQYATGPTDEELGVIAFREADLGFPIVTLVNYTAHALTIGNYKWVVTSDYPGVLAADLSRLTGGAVMFTQGACGNVHPYGFETGPARMRQMGETLSAKAHAVFTELKYTADAPVFWARRDVSLPVQKRMYETHKDWAPLWQNLDAITTDMTAARVGDVTFVGEPGELFVQVGLAIKRRSPSPFTYILYNTNDYASYIPTPEAYLEGGYEPNATLVGPGGAEVVEETGAVLAHEVWGA
jgi:neutral ceramidase